VTAKTHVLHKILRTDWM